MEKEPNRQPTTLQWLGLCILPIFIFLSSIQIAQLKGPYYFALNFDPEYAYLFNSLNLIQGTAPVHADHPGTPLQLLGALILVSQHFISGLLRPSSTIQQEALMDPESYLRSINLTLNVLILILGFLIGYRSFRYTRRWLPTLVLQLTPFLFTTLIISTTRVSPEPFLVVLVLLLTLLLIPVLSSSFRITSARDSIFLGLILGVSVAAKVTALPLMLLVLLPKTWRDKVITVVVSLIAFLIVTIPSWPRLWRLVNWLFAIATHDQHYGQGNVGLPSTEVLQDNFVALVYLDPGYFVFIILLAISFLFFLLSSRKRTRSQLEKDFLKTLSMLAIILIAQTSITVKHPAAHYNIPSMASVGLIIFALFNTPRSLWKSPFQARLFEYILGATIIFSLSFGLINLLHHINVVQDHRDVFLEMEEIRNAEYKDCTLVNYYRSSSIPFALAFGSHWSGFVHSPFLTETYPEMIFYNIWGQNFYDYHNETIERSIINERLGQGECIIMQGSRFSDGREINFARLTLEDIVSTNNEEALYRLVAVDDS